MSLCQKTSPCKGGGRGTGGLVIRGSRASASGRARTEGGVHCAQRFVQQEHGADAQTPTLRCGFRVRLTAGVRHQRRKFRTDEP
jgi:hypothetical protein